VYLVLIDYSIGFASHLCGWQSADEVEAAPLQLSRVLLAADTSRLQTFGL